MSKKIDGKFLKNLIKEAMKEDRLDEKTYNIKGWKDTSGKTFPPLDSSRIKDIKGSGKVVKKGTKSADYKAVADGGKSKSLEPDDLSAPNAASILNPNVETDPSKYGGGSPSGAAATPAELTAAGVSKSSNLTAWKNAVASAFAKDPALAKRLHVSFGELMYTAKGKDLPTNARTAYVKAEKIISSTSNPPGARSQVVTQVKDLYDAIGSILNKGIEPKDIAMTSVGDDMSAMAVSRKSDIDYKSDKNKTIKDKLNAVKAQIGKVQLDQSIANSFATLDGNTIEKRFEDLANTMKTIKSGNFTTLSDTELLEFTVKVDLAVKLGNLAKIEHASAAGFAFEKFVINMFGGIGAGDVNGAIDAVLQAPDGALIPTSQKLLADTSISQSTDAQYGLDNVLDEFTKVIYITGFKSEEKAPAGSGATQATGSDYSYLDIYVIEFYKSTSGDYVGRVLDVDGNTKYTATPKSSFTFSRNELGSKPTVSVPLLSVTSSEIDAIAKYVSSNTTTSPLFQSVEKAYRKLENMKRNTTSYRATANKGQSGVGAKLSATDYIDQIARDYSSIKKDFNTIFQPVSGTATTIAENVKKITPQFLKKLFKETLKK